MSDEATDGTRRSDGDRSLPVTAEFPGEGGRALDAFMVRKLENVERGQEMLFDQMRSIQSLLDNVRALETGRTRAFSAQTERATDESVRQGQGDGERRSNETMEFFAARDDVKAIVTAIVKGEQMTDDGEVCWKRREDSEPDTATGTEVPTGGDDGQGATGAGDRSRRGKPTCPFYLAGPNEANGKESLSILEKLLKAGRPDTVVTTDEKRLLRRMVSNSWGVHNLYSYAFRSDPQNVFDRLPVPGGSENTGCKHSEFPPLTFVQILGGDQHLDGYDPEKRLDGMYVVALGQVFCQGGLNCQCPANQIRVCTSHRYVRYRACLQQPSANAPRGADPSQPGTSQTRVMVKYDNHELQPVMPLGGPYTGEMPGADVIQGPGTPYAWPLALIREDLLAHWRIGQGQSQYAGVASRGRGRGRGRGRRGAAGGGGVQQEGVQQDGVQQEGVQQEGVQQDEVQQDEVQQDGVQQDGVQQGGEGVQQLADRPAGKRQCRPRSIFDPS
jgi:hypothetical protein